MPIQVPYYNLHQLILGQYTPGNEFVLKDGSDYIGLYYIIPTGQRFTGARPEPKSEELFVKRINQNNEVRIYNNINESQYQRYSNPVLTTQFPTSDDYERGFMERFFVQKRNSPLNTIIEIDSPQYNSVNVTNKPGINGVVWNKLRIIWKISKIPETDAKYLNLLTLQESEHNFPYISRYLTNPLEYYK